MTKNLLWFGLLPLAPAFAQGPAATPTPNLQTPAVSAPASPDVAGAPLAEDEVGLSAEQFVYDDNQDVVVASGEVRMQRNGSTIAVAALEVRAGRVTQLWVMRNAAKLTCWADRGAEATVDGRRLG